MAFTLDVNTLWGQVRYLIGDTNPAKPNFTDEDLMAFLQIACQSVLMACSYALRSLASRSGAHLQSVTLGDYQNTDGDKAKFLSDLADKFQQLEYDTPAFAVSEENLSSFNELTIIRNLIYRTEF